MSKIIDADKLTRYLNDWWYNVVPPTHEPKEVQEVLNITANVIESCIAIVDEQATAFDMDKVVEQIEQVIRVEFEFLRDVYGDRGSIGVEFDAHIERFMIRVINILKKGGAK